MIILYIYLEENWVGLDWFILRRENKMAECSVEGCDNRAHSKGLCMKHYLRLRKENRTVECSVEGCDDHDFCKGLCIKHYKRFRTNGTTDYIRKSRPSKARFDNGVCYLEVYNKSGDVVCETLIDEEDYDRVKSLRFHMKKRYVGNRGGQLHQLLFGDVPKGMTIDHKNRNRLDNRRKTNLRLATPKQQMMNMTKTKSNTSSIYKGVSLAKYNGRWNAAIKGTSRPVSQHIGTFDNEWDAAQAYNTEALKYFGEFAAINLKKGWY